MKKLILSLIFIVTVTIGFSQVSLPYWTTSDTTVKVMTYNDTSYVLNGDSVYIDLTSYLAAHYYPYASTIEVKRKNTGTEIIVSKYVGTLIPQILVFSIDSIFKYKYFINIAGSTISYFWIRGVDSLPIVDSIPVDTVPVDTTQMGLNLYPTDDSGVVLSVYPNPATDNINITFDKSRGYENTTIEIYDMSGHLIVRESVTGGIKTNIDVSWLKPGLYFVSVGNKKSKFVKQ